MCKGTLLENLYSRKRALKPELENREEHDRAEVAVEMLGEFAPPAVRSFIARDRTAAITMIREAQQCMNAVTRVDNGDNRNLTPIRSENGYTRWCEELSQTEKGVARLGFIRNVDDLDVPDVVLAKRTKKNKIRKFTNKDRKKAVKKASNVNFSLFGEDPC